MLDWDLREGLLAYLTLMKDDALEQYRFDMFLFAMGKLAKQPPMPRILNDV